MKQIILETETILEEPSVEFVVDVGFDGRCKEPRINYSLVTMIPSRVIFNEYFHGALERHYSDEY